MTAIETTLYEAYAVVDAKIKALTAEKDKLREDILHNMSLEGISKQETGFGKFTVTKLKTWTYPQSVTQLNEDFKAAKARAESTGDATYEESDSLRFTSVNI